jgi:hypothetical protein
MAESMLRCIDTFHRYICKCFTEKTSESVYYIMQFTTLAMHSLQFLKGTCGLFINLVYHRHGKSISKGDFIRGN